MLARVIISGLLGMVTIAGQAAEIALTPEELAYRDQAPAIQMCVDPDWPPFERIDAQGRHAGIAADLVQLVAQRTGLHITLHTTSTWDESLAASKSGQCQIMSFLNQTLQRESWLIFTRPVLVDRNIIVTREEHPFVADLADLQEKTIALPSGTMVEERIRNDFPKLKVLTTASEADAMTLVAERKADLAVRSMIVAAHAIRQQGLFNLKIAGQVPTYVNQLRIGVIKKEAILRDVLDKGIATITQEERDAIVNKHVPVLIKPYSENPPLWLEAGVAIILSCLAGYWYRDARALRKTLARRSSRLDQHCPSTRNWIEENLKDECLRCQRYGLPLSVIVVDISVPEIFRQESASGTQPFTELSSIVRKQTREVDRLGFLTERKWLIVCPQSEEEATRELAKRLKDLLSCQVAVVEKQWVIRLGVGLYRLGDQPLELVFRAEKELFKAT